MPHETPGPNRHPSKPAFTPPANACDAHIHLFGPASKYPFAADTSYTAPDSVPDDFFALAKALGVHRGVIVSPGAYGRDMTMLSDALATHPDRFRGIALMREDAADDEFERLGKLGVRGLRFMSDAWGGNAPKFHQGVSRRAHEHGWHVQFYPKGTDLIDYADKLLALPNVIVLDHFASIPARDGVDQPAMRAMMRMLDTGRVWVKLSGPMRCTDAPFPYPEVTPLARALVQHRPDRLVWGTDWPHVNLRGQAMPDDGGLLDLLLEWVPDEVVRNRILVENPAALYGF